MLILAGKVVFADGSPEAVQGVERLAVGVQRLAAPVHEVSRSQDRLDLMHLIGFGDRRKPHDFPGLLREDVADEIVLVQPLHDDDDGAAPLVVEPAVERVVVPLVGGFALRVGKRLLRLQGVIDNATAAIKVTVRSPAPGIHAPPLRLACDFRAANWLGIMAEELDQGR